MAAGGVSDSTTTRAVPRVVCTTSPDDLGLLSADPGVAAVILDEGEPPAWFAELGERVVAGGFDLGRLFLPFLPPDQALSELRRRGGLDALGAELADALAADLSRLVAIAEELSAAERLQLRLMALPPDRRHGFHLDTTAGPTPTVRVLRVYVGPGTEYVDPDDVTSQADYYREFLLRDRLSRSVPDADWDRATPDPRVVTRLAEMDARPRFLRPGAAVRRVPAGAVVAVRCIPKRAMWPGAVAAGAAAGWIHRSPAEGATRCFAAVSS